MTAGILRGDRARYQLFGDTVNTASRIETTGVKGLIHASETTARLLMANGKRAWVTPRTDTVEAKGTMRSNGNMCVRLERASTSFSL